MDFNEIYIFDFSFFVFFLIGNKKTLLIEKLVTKANTTPKLLESIG